MFFSSLFSLLPAYMNRIFIAIDCTEQTKIFALRVCAILKLKTLVTQCALARSRHQWALIFRQTKNITNHMEWKIGYVSQNLLRRSFEKWTLQNFTFYLLSFVWDAPQRTWIIIIAPAKWGTLWAQKLTSLNVRSVCCHCAMCRCMHIATSRSRTNLKSQVVISLWSINCKTHLKTPLEN